MQQLIEALFSINGVVAVGLGGSRGLGIADENSDYDFVLFRHGGEPVATPLIIDAIKPCTDSATIQGDTNLFVPQVSGKNIEVFQKDLSLVAREIAMAKAGKFIWSIRPLFPHGDLSTSLISHIVYLEICAEKGECVSAPRRLADPFPVLLMRSLIETFLRQATISMIHARKIRKAADLQYLFALCSGFVFYANIIIFALNRMYPIIERGGAKIILGLPLRPKNYEQRTSAIFQAACIGNLGLVFSELSAVLEELKALANEALNGLNTGDLSARPD